MRDVGQLIEKYLLPEVTQPGQYIALETNARYKDVRTAGVSIALAFPDKYELGISNLGSQILYHMINDMPEAAADRTYCPAMDAQEIMRSSEHPIPLFGWESRCAIADFDIIGFTLPYEMCVSNVLTMLDMAGVPIRSADRDETHPIIIAGDALADSPEPLADFVDIFIPGDGEGPLAELVRLVAHMKQQGASREDMILQAAREIESVYAPLYYQPGPNGLPVPTADDLPAVIKRARIAKLQDSPPIAAPLVPLVKAVQERVVIEIMRGCPNGCRFCQAGATRLPVRIRSVDEIVDAARTAIAATGFREISLLSLSTSDYPHLDELIGRLSAEFEGKHVSISLPSLRVDSQLRQLPRLTSTVRKGGLTIAAEAGTDRLRKAIRKNITEENMIAGVRAAYEAGWQRVKVYFMVGLPGETSEDIEAIYWLCRRLSDTRKDVDGHRGAISASVSWFVPKPHTPMQWEPMRSAEYFLGVRRQLRELSERSPVKFKFHRVERSVLEGALCRGDRRMGAVIEAAWRNGASMDAWDEHFDYNKWTEAFEQAGLDPAEISQRRFGRDDVLPWSHISCYRSDEFLLDEMQHMLDTI